jgi:hypothetical protein
MSLEDTTLKNSGLVSKRLMKPSLSRYENGQSQAKKMIEMAAFEEFGVLRRKLGHA